MGILDFLGGGDYGAQGYRNNQEQALRQAGGYYNDIGGVGETYLNYLRSTDDPAARASLKDVTDYLGQDYGTSQNDAADLARSTAGQTSVYDRARANLQARNARMGIDTSSDIGTPSSAQAGGMASIDAAQANQLAGAQQDLGYRRIAQRRQNLEERNSLLAGQAATDYGRGAQSIGAAAGGEMGLSSAYGGLTDEALQQSAAQWGPIGDLIGAGASIYGASRGGGRQPLARRRQPVYGDSSGYVPEDTPYVGT